jgi:hypothetical protein
VWESGNGKGDRKHLPPLDLAIQPQIAQGANRNRT